MTVWALGINHHSAPLDLRARFAFAAEQLQPVLWQLRKSFANAGVPADSAGHDSHETTILSTCNRTEIYGTGNAEQSELALNWLAQTGGVSPDTLRQHAYLLYARDASRHAFRVASGLDSMVLGEPQILGQLKDAVRAAEDAGTLGTTLHQLFQRSFSVAKDVRTHTDIGAHSISMAAAAVRLAAQVFERLDAIQILFVGAGEMIELAATHFAAKNPKQMTIANRSMERGTELAQRFGAKVVPLAELPQCLHEYDAVISCTASTLPIIGLGAVERALKRRKHKPMFMVDLAVPRDIEAEVKDLDDVFLYTVDDLAQVVQTGQATRQAAVSEAEKIIDAGVLDFEHWLAQRQVVPMIQSLQAQSDAWQAAEIARAKKRLAKGEAADVVLEALARGLAQKMLHGTVSQLRSQDSQQRVFAQQAIAQLFLQNAAASPSFDS